MTLMWQQLISNFAVVALAISVWAHVEIRLLQLSPRMSQVAFGIAIGVAATLSIAMAHDLAPGIKVDFRPSLMAIAGLCGGPIATAIAVVVVATARVIAGGAGVLTGIIALATFASLGLLMRYTIAQKTVRVIDILLLGVAVSLVTLCFLALLPNLQQLDALSRVGLPVAFLNFAAVLICGFAIFVAQRHDYEHSMLMAALDQAPDYLYVKDRRSRFISVNKNVALYNKFAHSSDMVGLTDFSLTNGRRAEELYEAEQEIMRSGNPLLDHLEHIGGRVFTTTKIPLRQRDGQIIGMAGVSRDITEISRVTRELKKSQIQLKRALENMSEGFAQFDEEGTLLSCNDKFRQAFPRTGHLFVPGANLGLVLQESVEIGEIAPIEKAFDGGWVGRVVDKLRSDCDQELRLSNQTWLSVRVRWDRGVATVIVSDITATKRAEEFLKRSAEISKAEALTDGLTGIANRRAFDRNLVDLQYDGNYKTISALMIDVDHFKLYNDIYGHQAGDECLQAVARNLAACARRRGDIVARYGGEEFAVLLPDCGVEGATNVANDLLKALQHEQMPHKGSQIGHVSVSVGIATWTAIDDKFYPDELISRADDALYVAKSGGRNRWALYDADNVPSDNATQSASHIIDDVGERDKNSPRPRRSFAAE